MGFEGKIEQGLKGLSRKQICQFAWLCGVRALPFLSDESFIYWPKEDVQKHLYSIFHALDVSVLMAFSDNFTTDAARVTADVIDAVTKTAYATKIAADDAKAVADGILHLCAIDTVDAINSARYAANAYHAAACAAESVVYAAKTAFTARVTEAVAYAANAANATNTAKSVYIINFDFETLLLNDIEAIKKNKLNDCNHNIGMYDELWVSFQKDLESIGCAYWAQFYTNLFNNGFSIDKDQLKRHLGVPDEVKAEGAAAVGRYLEGLGEQTERLNEARIIILGEKGAGKTSLARRLLDVNAIMPKEYESTEGVETSLWRFPGKYGADVNAHIWDFAGHSITHSAHRCFMSARCLYIYVYNGRIERDNDPAYWLEQIRIHGGDSPVLFLINEKDDHRADIAENTLKDEYPSIVDYYRVDIGNDDKTNLEEFRQTVMATVSGNPSWNSQVVSMEAYKIKNKLRERFSFNKEKSPPPPPHITWDEFDEIAKDCGASTTGRIEDILKDLHTLGICLWYNEPEMGDFNTLVLNPDWITNGIYRIINQSFKRSEHKLTTSRGTEILKDDERYEYPRDKVAYLFRLMRLYELAFFESTDNIFIPGILSIDRPDGVPAFNDANDRLTMSFVVEKALPPSITARIIVQRSEEIFDEKLLWRKGAVLKYKGSSDTIALIIEESRSITVCVKGTEKTAYIASLRETIKAIFDDYKGIKPDLLYEVLLPEKSEKSELPLHLEKEKPLMLSEEVIKGYLEKNLPFFDVINKILLTFDKTGQAYSINIIKNILEINTQEVNNMINSNINNSIIGNGTNGAINSPNAIVGSTVNQSLPATVTEEQFNQILEMLEKFLESEQKRKLTIEDFENLQKEANEASKLGFKKGWERFRRFLSDTANIATIGTAIATFLAAHTEIPEAVRSVFVSFMR
jgi:GTPase SAR1 family protein